MDSVASYIIKIILISAILYGYYLVALRNKKFHSYNRFYLLLSIGVSLVVPLFNFKWYQIHEPQNTSLNNLFSVIKPATLREPGFHFISAWLVISLSCLVSLVLFGVLLSKIAWIYNIKTKHKKTPMQGFTFIETRLKQAPFSFLDNMFWKLDISLDTSNGEKIFKHELTHIKQRHTYDKLFSQVIACFFWMNPFYWLIQKELNVIHEFIADANSIDEGDTESFAKMLLQAHNEGSYLTPSHSFYYSSIKRRLAMITISKNTPYSYMRRVFVLPVILLVTILFSFTVVKAQTDPKLTPGASFQVQKVSITKATGTSDSLADVRVNYIKQDGTAAVLNFANVKYSNAKINNDLGKQESKANMKKEGPNE